MPATITKTKHGAYEHGTPYRLRDGGFVRLDTYTTDREPRTERDLVHVLSAADDSPIYLGAYSPACSCCWLNLTHSAAVHADRCG